MIYDLFRSKRLKNLWGWYISRKERKGYEGRKVFLCDLCVLLCALCVGPHEADNSTVISGVYYKIVYLHENHYDYVKHY